MLDSENSPIELVISVLDGELMFTTTMENPSEIVILDENGNSYSINVRDLKNIVDTLYHFGFPI